MGADAIADEREMRDEETEEDRHQHQDQFLDAAQIEHDEQADQHEL